MFERFTDSARKAMALANEAAHYSNPAYIDTEHILLGILKEGRGAGTMVLKNLNVNIRKLRREIEQHLKKEQDMVLQGKLPQTQLAKKVIEYAIEETRALSHNYVGTEHLLLGLFRETNGGAARILMETGLHIDEVRAEVVKLTDDRPPEMHRGHCTQQLPPTLQTKKVLEYAIEEARTMNNKDVGPEYILLGLLRVNDEIAGQILTEAGLKLEEVRERIIKLRGDQI